MLLRSVPSVGELWMSLKITACWKFIGELLTVRVHLYLESERSGGWLAELVKKKKEFNTKYVKSEPDKDNTSLCLTCPETFSCPKMSGLRKVKAM